MSINNVKVGDTVFMRMHTAKFLTVLEARVAVNGNKYITVDHETLKRKVRFHKATGYEKCDGTPNFKLYASNNEVLDDIEREAFWASLNSLGISDIHALSLDQTRRITSILNEDNDQRPQRRRKGVR